MIRLHPALAFFALLPLSGRAVCTDQIWKPGWSSTYDGTIGPYRVRFEIAQTGGQITGYYFYVSQLKDIRLKGAVADGKQIFLQELDAEGRPEAEIRGAFAEKDPRAQLSGDLTCDIITGVWRKGDGSADLPVFLRMIASLPDPHGRRYEVAGASDDETINRAAETFRKAVMNGDNQTVVSMIRYPITVYISHQKTTIEDRRDMLANYDVVFSPGYRNAIADSIPRDMFARYDGIMLGDHGEVWFDERGRVTALNNILSK